MELVGPVEHFNEAWNLCKNGKGAEDMFVIQLPGHPQP